MIRYRLEWLVAVLLRKIVLFAPHFFSRHAGNTIGIIFWFFRIRYRVAYENLLRAFPEIPASGLRRILYRNYKNLGRTFVELLVLDDLENSVQIEQGEEHLKEMTKGGVLVSGHLGNWELMAKELARRGVPLVVIVRRQKNPYVDRLITDVRTRSGIRVVAEDDVWTLRRLAGDPSLVGIMADQDDGRNRRPIRFFNQVCFAPRGPEFFIRQNRSVFFSAIHRDGDRHRLVIQKVSPPDELDQQFATWFEQQIRQYPEQWLWHHRRWKKTGNAEIALHV